MSDLRDLYQDLILDHGRRPRNHCACKQANLEKEGYNPLCGDKLTVYLQEKDGVIIDASFLGQGCAISMASASMMTDIIKGKTVAEVKLLFNDFHDAITTGNTDGKQLGKLAVLTGVSEFPARVKCASLAWHTLTAALDSDKNTVTTE